MKGAVAGAAGIAVTGLTGCASASETEAPSSANVPETTPAVTNAPESVTPGATEETVQQTGEAEAADRVAMKPGVYVGEGRGFDWIEPVRVKITVDEEKLLSVDVIELELNREEPVIQQAANAGEPFAVNPKRYSAAYNNGEDYCEPDSLWDHWINTFAKGDCKEELVRLFFDHSGDTIDWLQFDHNVHLHTAQKGFGECVWPVKYQYIYKSNAEEGHDYGDTVLGDRSTTVGQYYDRLVKDFTDLGGEYLLEATCYELTYDTAADRVTGLKARGADGVEYVVNADVVILAGGVDEDFGKKDSLLSDRIQYGPYYAIKCVPTPYATLAALDIDTNINVLKTDGSVMNGLYACGNDSGGVLYSERDAYAQYGGVALGWAFTSGRLAGINAANYLETL